MFVSALAAAHPLEPLARLLIERVAQTGAARLLVARLLEVAEERSGGALLHRLAGRAADREVRRDEADDLGIAMLSGEPLENGVSVRRVAN